MEWQKSKIVRWTAGKYVITEDTPDAEGRPYRLDSPAGPRNFRELADAKAFAEFMGEIDRLKVENEELRADLADAGVWPELPDVDENGKLKALSVN